MSPDTQPAPVPSPAPAHEIPVHAGDSRFDALVDAVRCYRNAETAMRGKSRDSMHLGKTDMAALRHLLRAGQSGSPLNAVSLARQLEISTAATTVLIDRLEKSGHAERRRSRTDGRVVEIWPTASSDHEVRSTMGILHERMMRIAGALSSEERQVIHRFLAALGTTLGELDVSSPASGRS